MAIRKIRADVATLPNGLYTYYVWRHKEIKPALRLGPRRASTSC